MGSGDTLVLRSNADATSEQPGMVVVCVCAVVWCVITSSSVITRRKINVYQKGRINRFSQTNFKKWIDNNIPGMR